MPSGTHHGFETGMTRIEIRHLKRAIRAGVANGATEEDADRARGSASALLERSVQYGHKRLAIIRLAAAIRAGASVTPGQWKYCEAVISDSGEDALRQIVADAIHGVPIDESQAG